MPDKKGRFTYREKRFIKAMARTNDIEYSTKKAGFSDVSYGYRVAAKPAVQEATFQEVQRFLRDQGAAIGVYTLAELAVDTKTTAGVRRAAAFDLAKLSGVGIDDGAQDKEPHEMTADELARYSAKLERQHQAIEAARADRAKPVIQQDPAPKGDLFD